MSNRGLITEEKENKKEERWFMKTYEQLMEDAFKEMSAVRTRLYTQKVKAETDKGQTKLNV
jgi:hypothetical protein